MRSANSFVVRLLGSGTASLTMALVVGGCAVGNVPLFKKLDSSESKATAAAKEEELPDVHPMRKERATVAAKKFDIERNNAEFQAAAAEWRQGNFKACRDGLEKILHRDAAHRESLMLLAELELEQDRAESAVDVLRRGIESHPDDAELSYKLGLALEAAGEESEALHHFHVAVQLAPNEKKYAEVFQHAEAHARGEAEIDTAAPQDDRLTKQAPTKADEPIRLPSNETEPAESDVADNAALTVTAEIDSAEPVVLPEPQSIVEAARPIDTVMSTIEAASAAWDAGRKAECSKAIGAILARDPKHIEANILQVEIDLDAGRNDAARERIERLAISNPQCAQVRRACGLAYQALGDAARADSAFAMAETLELGAIEDTTPRSQLALEEAKRNVAAQRLDLPTSTGSLVIQQVSTAPSVPSVASIPVEVDTAKPAELTVDAFEPALPIVDIKEEANDEPISRAKSQLTAEQLLEKGDVFLKAGRYDDAKRELSAAISAKSCNVKTAAAAALAPLKYEQSALALSLAREGLTKYPDSAGLHRIEGTAALRLGKHLEAEAALRHSLNLDNSQALTYFLLGSVYDRLGNKEAADRHLRQAARLDGRYATRK